MANYENSMEFYEYKYQQSGRNEYRNHDIEYRVQYDFEGVEELKAIVRGGGILHSSDYTELRSFEHAPEYPEPEPETEVRTIAMEVLAEIQKDFLKQPCKGAMRGEFE